MDASPQEVAKFKAALAKLSPEGIRKRLDTSVIARAWKRDIAEAEFARREHEAEPDSAKSQLAARNEKRKSRSVSLRVWTILVLLIVGVLGLTVKYVFG
jgi:hypothetical protein